MWEQILRRCANNLAGELIASSSSSAIIGRETGRGYINVSIAENYFRSALEKLLPMLDNKQEGTK